MQILARISADIAAEMEKEIKAGERAVTLAMNAAGVSLKNRLREQVKGAGLGQRLANTIRSATYPQRKNSLNAAALVWTKAPKLVGAFDTGPTIRARDGFWLAIPTEDAGRSTTGGRITPAEWMARNGQKLRMVVRPGRAPLLVAERRVRRGKRGGYAAPSERTLRTGRDMVTVPMFILVPQVKLTKRLDVESAANDVAGGIAAAIITNWKS